MYVFTGFCRTQQGGKEKGASKERLVLAIKPKQKVSPLLRLYYMRKILGSRMPTKRSLWDKHYPPRLLLLKLPEQGKKL